MDSCCFCYVILHYKTEVDTIECIESILLSDNDVLIVVVDNASNNGSIEIVENKYNKDKRVHIIKNKENLGFSEGNNVGYGYAREVLKASFIAISNNDIIVVTDNFSKRVVSLYQQNRFHLLGPDIVSVVDGGHQNPMRETLETVSKVKKEIIRYRLLLLLSKCGIYDLIKPKKKVRTGSAKKTIPNEITTDIMLHGSFVVFSPEFVQKEEISFRKGTFLYTEEAILYKYCKTKKYTMVFSPFLCVRHKEDSATNSLNLTNKEKREFVFENMIRSLTVYLGYFS